MNPYLIDQDIEGSTAQPEILPSKKPRTWNGSWKPLAGRMLTGGVVVRIVVGVVVCCI